MKTLVVNQKNIGTSLPILGFVLLASLLLTIVPALANEFEVGTQFGISYIIPEGDDSTTITYTRLPSVASLDVGSSPTSLYATWFPNQQFGIGPEFSLARFSVSGENYWGEREDAGITSLHLGGRAAFFFLSHLQSSPYVLGRVSTTIFSGDDIYIFDEVETFSSFGIGLGYQWRIGDAFVFRAEGQYQRLLAPDDDDANEFSLIFGIGTRFGNSKNQNP